MLSQCSGVKPCNYRLSSDLIQCRSPILASDNTRFYTKEPEAKVLQSHHSRSGSYCCYVSPPDQSELNLTKSCDKTIETTQPSQNSLKSSTSLIQDKKGVDNDQYSTTDKKQVCFQLAENEQCKQQQQQQEKIYPASDNITFQLPGTQTNPSITLTSASNALDISPTRGEPPPYFSHHQVLKFKSDSQTQQQPGQKLSAIHLPNQAHVQPAQQSQNQQVHCSPPQQATKQSSTPAVTQNSPQSPPLPMVVPVCQRPHPPNAFCRTCLNVRRSHRQNAAAFVRRAHSSGYQHNRRSAPSPASSADSLDDAPSILERLKKEWEMGFLGPPTTKKETISGVAKKSDGSKTLPYPLGTTLQSTSSSEVKKDKEKYSHQEHQNNKSLIKKDDGDCKGKKDVSHLDRALNRLSMKRSSNPFGQKNININTENSKPTSDSSHQQNYLNLNVKTSNNSVNGNNDNSSNCSVLVNNSSNLLSYSTVGCNDKYFPDAVHKNVSEKNKVNYSDQSNSNSNSQTMQMNASGTQLPREGHIMDGLVLETSNKNSDENFK